MNDFFEHPEFLRQMHCLLAHVDKLQCDCLHRTIDGADEYECMFNTEKKWQKCTRMAKMMIGENIRDSIAIYKKYKE